MARPVDMARLKYLLELTPRESWRMVRRRMPLLRDGPAWTPEELLSSAKHGRGIRFAELLLRQEAVVRRSMAWEPLDFEERRVVEIGCGPLAGYGPLAIFCGARSFESAEPEWEPGLVESEAVRERYLRVFHADLSALYGPRMNFDEFRTRLQNRMTIHQTMFERAQITQPADIVLSQSCLEHVFPPDATIAKLAAIQTTRTRFLHLIDFGNHYPTVNPFEGLYEQPPSDYIARRGKAINLLREPDFKELFARHGIAARFVRSRMAGENFAGTVHDWWRERYKDDALFTQLVLVVGPST
jgi:hypothetical protein